jgi:serine/threonine protein phosphatase PrpC
MKLTVGTITDRGLNPRRTANEDQFFALETLGLFLVADGVGGRRGGQVASHTVVDVFSEAFKTSKDEVTIKALEDVIVECNRRIFDLSSKSAELEGMATTVAVLAIQGKTAIIGHVGDSRVYRFAARKLICETEDHSEVVEAVRAGQLSLAMAALDPRRNVLTRAIGVESDVEADFKSLALEEADRFLLCSDGITRHITETELEEFLSSDQHPRDLCLGFKNLCYKRGAEDNLTAIVVDVGKRKYAPSKDELVDAGAQQDGSRFRIDVSKPATPPAPEVLTEPAIELVREQRGPGQPKGEPVRRSGASFWWLIFALLLIGLIAAGAWLRPDLARSTLESIGITVASEQPVAVAEEPDPNLAAVKVLVADGRYDKAREQLLQMLSEKPQDAGYHMWLGRTYVELKSYEDAIRELNESIRLNGGTKDSFEYLALAFDAVGDRDKAKEARRNAMLKQ